MTNVVNTVLVRIHRVVYFAQVGRELAIEGRETQPSVSSG